MDLNHPYQERRHVRHGDGALCGGRGFLRYVRNDSEQTDCGNCKRMQRRRARLEQRTSK